jgi:5'-phosphate synthase pdxT subunit
MTFIRAPYIASISDNTEALAQVGSKIVAARQGNQLVTAFHPELTKDLRVHQYFAKIVKQNQERSNAPSANRVIESDSVKCS